jgi:UDP-GlcNAc3NAcA epimerase
VEYGIVTRVTTVVGARPQFVKAAMTSRAFAEAGIDEALVHTGQHYDASLSRIFFDELGLPREAVNLGVGSGSHGAQTGSMLASLEEVFRSQRPDAVLVFGDTNSTLAAALAAVKMHIPVGHVEAGMRSFNRAMPEEINRVVTDHVATWHYCATDTARVHLANEAVVDGVHVVGDVMADAVQTFIQRAPALGELALALPSGPYALMTCHRAENTDDPAVLAAILEGVGRIAAEVPVVYPVHPRTRARLESFGLTVPAGIRLVEPVGYLDMLRLTSEAVLVLTDSGGLQKEAYLLETPCVTLRTETEWVETVDAGWNTVVGSTPGSIAAAGFEALKGPKPVAHPNLYGDGDAARKIATQLASSLS